MPNIQLSKEELFKKIVLEIEVQKIFLDIPIQNHFSGERISEELGFLNGERIKTLDKKNFDHYYWGKYLQTVEELKQATSIGEAITKLKTLIFHFNEMIGKQYLVMDASYFDKEKKFQLVNFVVSNSKVGEWINTNVTIPLTEKVKKLEELKAIFHDDQIGDSKSNTPQETFESYLNAKGKKILPKLIETYSNAKPEIIAVMVVALEALNYLSRGSLSNNRTKLHTALERTFGNIGARQSLNGNLNKFTTPDEYQSNQINIHKDEIKKASKS